MNVKDRIRVLKDPKCLSLGYDKFFYIISVRSMRVRSIAVFNTYGDAHEAAINFINLLISETDHEEKTTPSTNGSGTDGCCGHELPLIFSPNYPSDPITHGRPRIRREEEDEG